MERLHVSPDTHFLLGDSAEGQAAAVVAMLRDASLRKSLSRQVRGCNEEKFGHCAAAQVFARICLRVLKRP